MREGDTMEKIAEKIEARACTQLRVVHCPPALHCACNAGLTLEHVAKLSPSVTPAKAAAAGSNLLHPAGRLSADDTVLLDGTGCAVQPY